MHLNMYVCMYGAFHDPFEDVSHRDLLLCKQQFVSTWISHSICLLKTYLHPIDAWTGLRLTH